MATYTNLNDEIFANGALEGFVKELLPFSLFSRNFSAEPGKKGDNILVPLVAGLTATTFGGSYAICGGSKSVVTVNLNRHKHVPIGQNDLDANNSSASSLESFGYQQGAALATAVLQDVLTLCTTANFALCSAVASGALNIPELRLARLLLNQNDAPRNPRSLMLDCVPSDALLAVTNFVQAYLFKDQGVLQEGRIGRALGFDLNELNSLFPATGSVMGFASHASAIAIAMRYLMPQEGHDYPLAQPVTDAKTGATFGIRKHYDKNTGSLYMNLECNYGFAVGLTTAGRILKRTD